MTRRQQLALLIVSAATLWGCGTANTEAPRALNGTHPALWAAPENHGLTYLAQPGQCRECHGPELLGGISKVSCSTDCHVHANASDWQMTHGSVAKGAPGTQSGFAFCIACHGSTFQGSPLSRQQGCMATSTCHFHEPPNQPEMPHDPWNGRSPDFIQHVHTDTNEGNAPVCALCHQKVMHHKFYAFAGYTSFGNLFDTRNRQGAPAGTPPGCFNNTLCHGDIKNPAVTPSSIWPPPATPPTPPVWPQIP